MAEEAVAVAREIDAARTVLKGHVLQLKTLDRAFILAKARYQIECTRVTDGLANGKKYELDSGKPGEQLIGGGKVAAANIKRLSEGVVVKWFVKMSMAKINADVCRVMIDAAKADLDALRSKNKYLTHT